MSSNQSNNPFEGLINETEAALKNFVSIYNIDLIENKTNHEMYKKTTTALSDQNKTNIDQAAEELYEKAHNLETLFLKHRFEISQKAPEQLVKEEIECLKAELKRKEDLLNDTKEKLAGCENLMRNFSTSLDNALQFRLDNTTHGYLPNESAMGHHHHPHHHPQQGIHTPIGTPTGGNPTLEQQTSSDGVILIQ